MRCSKHLIVFVLLSSAHAWCQVQSSTPIARGWDVFGGYVYGSGNSNQEGGGARAGVDVDNVFKRMGVTGEFDFTSAFSPPSPVNATSEWDVLAGPRFSMPLSSSSRIAPFADGLVGVDTFHNAGQAYTFGFNNRTTFAWAVDGGLDFRLANHIALRGQAGYLGTTLATSTDGNPGNGPTVFAGRVRVAGSVVFRF